jgi:hypothetical protein
VQKRDLNEDGHHDQSLIVACMSANLTRAGWWENVEVCHIEEIAEGAPTRLRKDLLGFLNSLEVQAGPKSADGNQSVTAIKGFLKTTTQRSFRSSDGCLYPHFFRGRSNVTEFLENAAGSALNGLCLEIISPYFDAGPESKPLSSLVAAFRPREVRVFLPRNDAGEALCSEELSQWVGSQRDVQWSRLPEEIMRGGKTAGVKSRTVHAKVYRFFQTSPKREYLFVGSVNLTDPAHRRGGNLETGFLVDLQPVRRPDWWLEPDLRKVNTYEPRNEDEGAVSTTGSRLSLRYWWNSKRAEAFWDCKGMSPLLTVSWNGESLFRVGALPEKEWIPQATTTASVMERVLQTTSVLTVEGDRPEPAAVLIQEEGMAQRPSLLFDLSPAEILRYWALLSADQRAAFLEAHAPDNALNGEGAELVARYAPLAGQDGFFDRFAGIFLSFEQFEANVRRSLSAGNTRAAGYRLFGRKLDSLGTLLARVRKDSGKYPDQLSEHYVMALCARQTVTELRRDHPGFFGEHTDEVRQLEEQLQISGTLRNNLTEGGDLSMRGFLDWFEEWFLRRAKPIAAEAEND